MNLVKLQDDLKMLPMAALQAKAQGQDPQVPPWLATSVLNERMDAQKKASLSQGAQGPQPSIAEQISQKAGLMALQGQQQQQAQQQMMNQMAQAPQPASENVPQPEPQPEPQMMAQGGLARLPVDSRMFNYREGGIIGFAEGDTVPPAASKERRPGESFADFRRRMFQLELQTEKEKNAAEESAREQERQRRVAAMGESGIPPSPFFERKPLVLGTERPTQPPSQPPVSAPPAGLPSVLPQRPGQPRVDMAAPPPPPPPAAAAAPRPRVAPAAVAPTAQRPTQPPAQQPPAGIAALPAAQQQSPIETARGISAAFPVTAGTPSVEAFLAEKNKFREASGAKRAGEPQQQQIDAYQAESARIRKERERSDAIAALSGYGGLGELAQRSAAISQRNILADTIRNDATEAMRVAMEGMKQAEAEGNMTKYAALKKEATDAQNTRANANALAASRIAEVGMTTATTQRGQDITAATAAKQLTSEEERAKARDITDRRGQDLHLQAAKLTSAAADVRADKAEQAQKLAELRSLATSFQALIKEPIDPLAKPAEIEAAKKDKAIYRQDYESVLAAIAKMSGNVSLQSGRGVAPTMDANRASQFKVIR